MSVSSISSSMMAQSLSAPQIKNDPDGGADRAREQASRNAPTDVVQLSAQAKQYLAAGIANDADHGADGK